MKKITKIEAAGVKNKKKLRVAAYARVSTDSDEQLVSLETQKIITSDTSRQDLSGNMLASITTKG